VGEPLPIGEIPDLAARLPAAQVRLFNDKTLVDRGVGANVLDSPLLALAFLIEGLAAQPESPALSAGEIVSTGTLTDAYPVKPGETWSTSFEGLPLPGLTLEFT